MVPPNGLFIFSCNACEESFPARCGEHRVLRENIGEETLHRTPALRLEQQMKQRKPELLPYGEPIPGYDAPYELLELEIRGTLRDAR